MSYAFPRRLPVCAAVALLIAPAAAGAADSAKAPVASAAATTSTLLRIYDASNGAEPSSGWEAYARFRVTGSPRDGRNWSSWQGGLLSGVSRSTRMDALTANARNVARTICDVRNYCGRKGWIGYHGNGDQTINAYVPWDVLGNDPANESRADRSLQYVTIENEDVMEGNGDPNVPANDNIAHEFGHIMDAEYAGDRAGSQNLAGDAVEEAIADMFAFDYDWTNATIGEGDGSAMRDLADPGSILRDGQPYPAHMRDYDSTPPDNSEHFNSTILSHAYYLFVQRVGRSKAGSVLHHVPQRLSPRPTFDELRRAFNASAKLLYGQSAADHSAAAFAAVGLKPPPPDEPDCGPLAC